MPSCYLVDKVEYIFLCPSGELRLLNVYAQNCVGGGEEAGLGGGEERQCASSRRPLGGGGAHRRLRYW